MIRCSRLFDLVFDILEVPMPDVELVARPPALHVRSSIKPGCDPLQSGGRIVRAAPKFYYDAQRVFSSASAAVASVRFNGCLDEGVSEFVEPVFSISRDDQMPSHSVNSPRCFFLRNRFFISQIQWPNSALAVIHPLH